MRGRRAASATLTVLSAVALTVAPATAAHAAAPGDWTVRPNPLAFGASSLYGVSAAAPDALWTGGYQWRDVLEVCGEIGGCAPIVHQNPVLQRWNGFGWSWISTPGLTGQGQIKFVDAVSATEAWAAGSRDAQDGRGFGTPYIARADARGWQEVHLSTRLRAVEALDADAAGVWVAGMPLASGDPSVYQLKDGQWYSHAVGATIQGIGQRTPTDVWAVGRVADEADETGRPYAARFDGSTWHTVTPPQILGKEGRLVAVLPLAADDVWLTGYTEENEVRKDTSFHWDGTSWQEHTLPAGARFGGGLYHDTDFAPRHEFIYEPDGLIEDGAGGLWAVGRETGSPEPRILHYTGGSWRAEATVPGVQGRINGITRVPGTTTLWAVGQRDGKAPLVLYTE